MGEPSKTCSKCGTTKPVTDFFRDSGQGDGYYPSCKECKKVYAESRKSERAEYQREYYERNRQAILARTGEYQRSDPERTRSYNRKYNSTPEGREKKRRYSEEYRRADPGRAAAQRAEFRRRHPDKYRKDAQRRRAMLSGVKYDPSVTIQSLRDRDGDSCCYCARALDFHCADQYAADRATLEHITPIRLGGSHTFDNTALSCRRCNTSKGAKVFVWQWTGNPNK